MKSEIKKCEDAIKLAQKEIVEWIKFLKLAVERLKQLKGMQLIVNYKQNARHKKNPNSSKSHRKRVE
jgi:hypothetical protein